MDELALWRLGTGACKALNTLGRIKENPGINREEIERVFKDVKRLFPATNEPGGFSAYKRAQTESHEKSLVCSVYKSLTGKTAGSSFRAYVLLLWENAHLGEFQLPYSNATDIQRAITFCEALKCAAIERIAELSKPRSKT